MMITRETDYAIRALLYLAQQPDGTPQSAATIAEAMEVPYRFMRRILLTLKDAGMVTSVRGKQGGLRLAKDPGQVSLLDIATAVDPMTVTLNRCLAEPESCTRTAHCPVHRELARIQQVVAAELAACTLADLRDTKP